MHYSEKSNLYNTEFVAWCGQAFSCTPDSYAHGQFNSQLSTGRPTGTEQNATGQNAIHFVGKIKLNLIESDKSDLNKKNPA